jgi:hypothetical protein
VECTNTAVQDVVDHTFHTCEENKGDFVSMPPPPQDIVHTPFERAIDALLDCTLFPPVVNSTGGVYKNRSYWTPVQVWRFRQMREILWNHPDRF